MAVAKRFADLGIVSGPNGGFLAPIERIMFDYPRNIRVDYGDCEPNKEWNPSDEIDPAKQLGDKFNPGLFEDVMMHGILVPLDVSLLDGKELADARKASGLPKPAADKIVFRGIRGHRRFKVLTNLHRLFPKDSRFSMVPVTIHEGLTYQQEMDLLVDQFGVKTLNPCEIVNAIKALRKNGLSEVSIASRIGKSRGFVQRRLWILGFPQYVFDAWVAYTLKRDDAVKVNLTDTVLVDLNKAATEDRRNGRPLESVGSDFSNAWKALIEPSIGENGEPAPPAERTAKAMSRSEVQKLLDEQKDLDTIIRSTLEIVIKTSTTSLAALDSACKTLRSKAAEFDRIKAPAAKKAAK